ncbi:MAG: hypothetical protein L0J73_13695, partial [Halomonas sp.]|nr:hypothetical protein [Halomonas sp.]
MLNRLRYYYGQIALWIVTPSNARATLKRGVIGSVHSSEVCDLLLMRVDQESWTLPPVSIVKLG